MVNAMTENDHEQISSLIDDELPDSERSEAIDSLGDGGKLRQRWERYHLISDVLGNNLPDAIDQGFADRVRDALAGEPAVLAPRRSTRKAPAIVKQVAGLAVAATVAAVAILAVQEYNQSVAPAPQKVAQKEASGPVPGTGEWIRVSGVNWNMDHPKVESKLNNYLVNHNGYSSGMQGILPYAKIVGYDSAAEQEPGQPPSAAESMMYEQAE